MAGYGTDDGLTAYATANGLIMPAGGNITAARQRGSLFVDGVYGDRFSGRPTDGAAQDREWPRTGASDTYGNVITPDLVPARVEYAVYEAAIAEINNPGILSPVVIAAERVKREKVGPLETEFFEGADAAKDAIPSITAIDGLLRPLLVPVAGYGPAILVV
ncbi:DnaT-like ssDNA-binding protein [Fulvimarina sp. 2208YS6-2-32]|uniref:DnaT-like ssDNA-binding protein n=1 Tax=Fulvimarina uroteuthidis TaxID=3098149 RepID=A0ABU5HYW5_9HYPH|nr:DnaT-like ssDNA-binding protein [Fulvimarina sp. 2208YS6-2-32]MDY8108262.1 DnaT-like ssDNA-binding protein [Fulvimarina sp. 2208YS6-2-32]